MAERTRGAHRRGKLVAPGIDHDHRQDGEGRAEEHVCPTGYFSPRKRTNADITANSNAEMILSEIALTRFTSCGGLSRMRSRLTGCIVAGP